MKPTYQQFIDALKFIVAIEPDPELDIDYDEATAPYAKQIEQAEDVIQAYGRHIAPNGLDYMLVQLRKVLSEQTDLKSESIMRSCVNRLWHEIGDWRG